MRYIIVGLILLAFLGLVVLMTGCAASEVVQPAQEITAEHGLARGLGEALGDIFMYSILAFIVIVGLVIALK